jgi:hypothetical protein
MTFVLLPRKHLYICSLLKKIPCIMTVVVNICWSVCGNDITQSNLFVIAREKIIISDIYIYIYITSKTKYSGSQEEEKRSKVLRFLFFLFNFSLWKFKYAITLIIFIVYTKNALFTFSHTISRSTSDSQALEYNNQILL